jgi:hypothetical protein
MTTMTLTAADCCAPRARRLPMLRRLVLSTGLALVAWSRRPVRRRSHEEQARSIRAESMREQAAAPFRYGAAQ